MDRSFRKWCKEIQKLGYKPEPNHELEWVAWFNAGLTPSEAREQERLLWLLT